jgi:transcriptional regulator with XRE-family HTH domain
MTEYLAPDLLSCFIKAKLGLTQAEAAEQLGIVPSALTGYLGRKQRPRGDIRKRIEIWSGGAVPESSWLTAEEAVRLGQISAAYVPAAERDESVDADEITDTNPSRTTV